MMSGSLILNNIFITFFPRQLDLEKYLNKSSLLFFLRHYFSPFFGGVVRANKKIMSGSLI